MSLIAPPRPVSASAASSAVKTALANSGYYAVALLNCDFNDGVVVLSGAVPSYYLKQVAQEALMHLDVVREVDNRVEVRIL